MSGHSKWANIKRKKEANDKEKGTAFAKLSRLITLAVVEGGGIPKPESNSRLRFAVEKAKSLNMPKETITRAIEKGFGPNKVAIKEVVYEAFAPFGVLLMIPATTDNSNRTHSELRNVLERNGGKIGGQGSVGYNFQRCGVALFENADESAVFDFADKIDEIDVEEEGSLITVYFPFDHLGKVHDYLGGLSPSLIEPEYRPQTTVQLTPEQQEKVHHLIEQLEAIDDVQAVYSNMHHL
jgi:YebC/PmpR family DNA-binding regulatory protein